MQPARGLTGELLHVREERDHVVTRGALDLVDGRRVQREVHVADGGRGPFGHQPRTFHRLARGELDLQPHLVARAIGPQLGEF